jgi:hypothetical protein
LTISIFTTLAFVIKYFAVFGKSLYMFMKLYLNVVILMLLLYLSSLFSAYWWIAWSSPLTSSFIFHSNQPSQWLLVYSLVCNSDSVFHLNKSHCWCPTQCKIKTIIHLPLLFSPLVLQQRSLCSMSLGYFSLQLPFIAFLWFIVIEYKVY